MRLNQSKMDKRQTNTSFWLRLQAFVIILLGIGWVSFVFHPYNVSYTTITLPENESRVDIDIEIFTHDLEKELKSFGGSDSTFSLGDSLPNKNYTEFISKYISSVIELEINSKINQNFEFWEISFVEDRTHIQFSILLDEPIKDLLLRNVILLSEFAETQQNIVELTYNGTSKKSLFSQSHTMESWKIP
jgi:hypothetical protein